MRDINIIVIFISTDKEIEHKSSTRNFYVNVKKLNFTLFLLLIKVSLDCGILIQH